jgi:hypothetical protein
MVLSVEHDNLCTTTRTQTTEPEKEALNRRQGVVMSTSPARRKLGFEGPSLVWRVPRFRGAAE